MKVPFVKYSGNGNDFIIIDENPSIVLTSQKVSEICDRHFGIGADGILICGKPADADGSMRIFNSDGGEAEMCGNGLRCLATYLDDKAPHKKNSYLIRTLNNRYEIIRRNGEFAILMSEIKDENAADLSSFNDFEKKYFIHTGVPHLVFLSHEVKKIDIKKSAPLYRFHPAFTRGTNVSFVELLPEPQSAYVRTYERGVEDETHSCGTGLTATGLALSSWFGWKGDIHLHTLGGKQTVSVGNSVYYSGEVKFCFSGVLEL